MNVVPLETLITLYRQCRDTLARERDFRFPHGIQVIVDQRGKYQGTGVAADSRDCPPDEVAVTIENGNVWQYRIECVSRSDEQLIPTVEILNPAGIVSYRRPANHKDVFEALRTIGYSVRFPGMSNIGIAESFVGKEFRIDCTNEGTVVYSSKQQ